MERVTHITHLQLEPTSRCNFTCGFCCGRKMEQSDLAYETFTKTLDTFPTLEQIELQGEGESLMHPRFFDMLNECKRRGIRVSLISNGSFFAQDAVTQILDAGVEKISVSIESADAEAFREIRGGKLDKVTRGIALLMEERKARGLVRPVVGFSVTVLNRTRDSLAGILALYRSLGLDGGITMQPLQQMASYTESYSPEMVEQMLSRSDVDRVWVKFRSNSEVKKIQAERQSQQGFHDDLMLDWKPAQRTCPWLEKGLYVSRDGIATPCCMIKDERFAYGRVGKVRPDVMFAKRDELREELGAGRIPEPCGGCEIARFAVKSRWGLIRFAIAGAMQIND